MRHRYEDSPIKRFFYETPIASMLLKILELFTVSMGFSFVLTFIIGSGLAKIIYYRPTEVTYTTLFISVAGFFTLGGIFLNGFRQFCHSTKEYLLIMLSAYSVYFFLSYWGLGLKFLPISDDVLQYLPDWLYNGWSNQTFENIFLPLRIFAYYQWMPDWASLTVVHLLYITMIVLIAYRGGYLMHLKSFVIKKEFESDKSVYPQTAKARARYEKRRRDIMRRNRDMLEDADVDYNSEEYNAYIKDAFDGKEESVEYPVPDSFEVENPNYDDEYDEYMKDAFDTAFDEEAPQEAEEFENYNEEFDEYMKDAFVQEPDETPDGKPLMGFEDEAEYEEYQEYEKEFDEYIKDAFNDEE